MRAQTLVVAARPLAMNERERAHFDALSQMVEGARAAAVAVLDRHLMSYPLNVGSARSMAVDFFG